jgi:hypothetical protein
VGRMGCSYLNTVLHYMADRLSGSALSRFELHLFECRLCLAAVEWRRAMWVPAKASSELCQSRH